MRKITLLLSLCLACLGAAAQTLPFVVADAPTDGTWATGTHWYVINNGNARYLSGSYTNANGDLVLTNGTRPTDDHGKWCIVGDETNGYSFYNKATGKLLGMTPSVEGTACHARLVEAESPEFGVKYAFAQSTKTGDNWWCFKQQGSDNRYACQHNNADGRLSYWNSSAATNNDNGCAFKFTLVEVQGDASLSWAIDRTHWTVTAQNETPLGNEGGTSGPAAAMIDGNDDSYWHSDWLTGSGETLPQSFTIDLGSEQDIAGFGYLPRPENGNGTCAHYKMYVSDTPYDVRATDFAIPTESPFLEGDFTYNGNNRVLKSATSATPTRGRYILFVSTQSKSSTYFTCAELYLLKGTAANKNEKQVQLNIGATNTAASLYKVQETNAGMPGYLSVEAVSTLGAAIEAAYAAATSGDNVDAALTGLQNAKSASPVLYPEGVYFTLTNTYNRGAVIYDPEKGVARTVAEGENTITYPAELDATHGNAEYLQEATGADASNKNHLWSLYHNEELDEYYLYNVGKRQFANIGEGMNHVAPNYSSYGATWIFSDTPVAFHMEPISGNSYHITGDGTTMSISTAYTGPIITYYSDGDQGVPFRLEKSSVAEDTEATAAIAALVTAYNETEVIRRTQEAARAALAKTGVGYPVAEAQARQTLEAAIEANTTHAQVADLNAAIIAYKATTDDIQMPEDGKAYTFTAVCPNGTKFVLMYSATNGLSWSTDLNAEKAVFVCHHLGHVNHSSNSNLDYEKYIFVNNEGKFMGWRGTDSHKGYYDSYSYTESNRQDWADISVRKLKLANIHTMNQGTTQANLFGFMEIRARRGTTGSDSYPDGHATWIVRNSDHTFNNSYKPYFSDAFTSALLIEETDYPNQPTLNTAHGIEGIEAIATFSAPFATVIPEGVTAYYPTEYKDAAENHTVRMEKVTGAIPANTGVILTGASGQVRMAPAADETLATLGTNYLGNSAGADKVLPADATGLYILANKEIDGNNVVAFYNFNTAGTEAERTLGMNKAYLDLSSLTGTASYSVRMDFGRHETGVQSILKTDTPDAPVYDLSGRRVTTIAKGGIYIRNGRKFIVK